MQLPKVDINIVTQNNNIMSEQTPPIKEHWKKLFNPTYLGSWDLVSGEDASGKPIYREITVEVESVKKEKIELQGQLKEEVLVRFKGGKKPLILKPENSKLFSKELDTPMYANWVGHKVTLHVVKVSAFNQVTDAIRVKYTRK